MLDAAVTAPKKRRLREIGGDLPVADSQQESRVRLAGTRLGALRHFAPLLAVGGGLCALILAITLLHHVEAGVLGAWVLTVAASNWLMVRRVETTSLLYLARPVPFQARLGMVLMVLLVAGLWCALPVSVYRILPPDAKTITIAAMSVMMCIGLAIATAPAAATAWASSFAAGMALALFLSGDSYGRPLTLLLGFQFGFVLLVVRRLAAMTARHAEEGVRQVAELETASRLMREYEERGTGCLWQTDRSHLLTYTTPGMATLFNQPSIQLIGAGLPALVGGNTALGAAMLSRSAFNGIEVEIQQGGQRRSVTFSGKPIIDSGGAFLGFRGSCDDVTETRSSEQRLRQLASLDMLTQLPNRMRMRELLGDALLSARASGTPCGILMLDLDGFKPVNDTFGHPKGDQVLKTVADRLSEVVDTHGIVGRLGGDEFAIVLHDAQNRRSVSDLAELLIARLSEPYPLDTTSVRIGASIGSAFGPVDGDTVDELIKKADLALYEAKSAGRGTYRQFERSMQTEAENRLKLELDLRQALALDQFRLYYQPLVDAQNQEVVGFEALLRWQHPVRGFVSPAEFIPLAEEVGVIHEIGEWVARTAAKDCARFPAPISVAINLSPVQLKSANMPAIISDALSRAKLPANRLEVEVTEGVFLHDSDGSLDVLRRLRALGVRISLDDFGTGYSSLGYLNRTIFNKLKIDGSFVKAAATRPETVSIIQAIVTLANCFQMTITAEGVETQDDYHRMQELGCHQIQGYLFGRPVPFERAAELVGAHWSQVRRLASA